MIASVEHFTAPSSLARPAIERRVGIPRNLPWERAAA